MLITAATLLNPFLLVYVPFALQEGVLMACCLPLLFLWVAAKDWDAGRRAALVLSMALLAYIIRAALVWWLLPAVLYAAWLLWPRRRQARTWLPWMAAVVVGGIVVIGPQIYISKQHSNSFNPVSVHHGVLAADSDRHHAAQVRDRRRRGALARAHLLVALCRGTGGREDRGLLPRSSRRARRS